MLDLDVIEQKFDYGGVSAASAERIRELQQRVRRMEGVGVQQELRLLPALGQVMTVRTGTVCSVDSPGLALALAAGASQEGAWLGFAGLPEVGWEAASGLGIDLDRTVAVPFPGEHWLSVTAALIDVLGVVIARPPGRVTNPRPVGSRPACGNGEACSSSRGSGRERRCGSARCATIGRASPPATGICGG